MHHRLVELRRRSRRRARRTCLAALLLPSVADAGDLDSWFERLAQHPSVVALERRAEAGDHSAEAALGLPDPQVGFALNNVPVRDPAFDRFLPTHKAISFAQRVPNPARRRAESERLASEASVPRIEAAYQLAQLRAQLLSALVERERIAAVDALLARRAKLHRELGEMLSGQLASGLAVYADLSRTDAALADVERRRNELLQARLEAESDLERLVGTVPAVMLPTIGLDADAEPLPRLYPLLIARQRVRAATRAVDVSRADFLPSFGVSAAYQQREQGPGFSGDDWFSVQATMTVPLWSRQRQQPAFEGAVAARAARQATADDAALTWRRRLEVLRGAHATAMRNIALLEEQARLVANAADGARRNYESGLEPLRSVLSAELDRNQLQVELVDQRARARRIALEHNSHLAGARPAAPEAATHVGSRP